MRKILLTLCILASCTCVSKSQDFTELEIREFLKNKKAYLEQQHNEKRNIDFQKQRETKSGIKSVEFGNAPDWKWESQFGGTGEDFVRDIVTDSEGNVYLVGSFSGEMEIKTNKLISAGDRDAIVAKFDNSGNLIWVTQLESGSDAETDIFGRLYLDCHVLNVHLD